MHEKDTTSEIASSWTRLPSHHSYFVGITDASIGDHIGRLSLRAVYGNVLANESYEKTSGALPGES